MLKLTFADNVRDFDQAIAEFADELGRLSSPAPGEHDRRQHAAGTRHAPRTGAGGKGRSRVRVERRHSNWRGPQGALSWLSRYLARMARAAGFDVATEGLPGEGAGSIHL